MKEQTKVETVQQPTLESIEERQARLKLNRDRLKQKNEPAKTIPDAETDVFRRTGLKFNETEEQKQLRLKRCMNVLKQVNAGTKTSFVPLEGVDLDPRSI